MTLLPILRRELLVRSRSPSNYWGRLAVGVIAILVVAPTLMWSTSFAAQSAGGREAFDGLVAAAFLMCCASCLQTSDAISSERREGTLGLLLLTDAKHFDLLSAKLASNGLACMAGLAAFAPVLALPVLVGGITGGELIRKALGLFNVMFVALSVGLWASSRGTARFRTTLGALIMLGTVVFGPLTFGIAFGGGARWIGALCGPVGTFFLASDMNYLARPNLYWISLLVVQIYSWVFLFFANVRLRRREAETVELSAAKAKEPAATPKCSYCGHAVEDQTVYCPGCGTCLQEPAPPVPASARVPLNEARTPVHWLLSRQRARSPMLWLGAWSGFLSVFAGSGGPAMSSAPTALGIVMSGIAAGAFAWSASRFFVEAQRSGELELLMTTPAGAVEIVSAQWDVFKSLAIKPFLLMLFPVLLQGALMIFMERTSPYAVPYGLLFRPAEVFLSTVAVCWLGFWFGLRANSQAKAALWSVLLTIGVPWVFGLTWMALFRGAMLVVSVFSLLYWLWLIRHARRKLGLWIGMRGIFESGNAMRTPLATT